MDLVDLVRKKLTKLEKKNISPLIVQGVHERDIIRRLRDEKIRNIFEYEWVSQLRFELVEGELLTKCMQTIFP